MNPERREPRLESCFERSRSVSDWSLASGVEMLLARFCLLQNATTEVLSWSKGRLPGHDKGRVTTEPITQRLREGDPGQTM